MDNSFRLKTGCRVKVPVMNERALTIDMYYYYNIILNICVIYKSMYFLTLNRQKRHIFNVFISFYSLTKICVNILNVVQSFQPTIFLKTKN